MNATAASVVSNKGGEPCVGQVRREAAAPAPDPALLLLCSWATLFAAAQGTDLLDGDDGGDHVSNGGDMLNACGRRKGDMALALLCLGNRPNTKPAAASPLCLGFQASYSEGGQAGTARQERGLRMPSPLLPASVSVMASCVQRLPARLPALQAPPVNGCAGQAGQTRA